MYTVGFSCLDLRCHGAFAELLGPRRQPAAGRLPNRAWCLGIRTILYSETLFEMPYDVRIRNDRYTTQNMNDGAVFAPVYAFQRLGGRYVSSRLHDWCIALMQK